MLGGDFPTSPPPARRNRSKTSGGITGTPARELDRPNREYQAMKEGDTFAVQHDLRTEAQRQAATHALAERHLFDERN